MKLLLTAATALLLAGCTGKAAKPQAAPDSAASVDLSAEATPVAAPADATKTED
jgi:uncharacterized lipoprotein